MDTFATQTRRHNTQRIRFLREEWNDCQKPALDRIETAARTFLAALDGIRPGLNLAKDIEAVDALACDTGGRTLDLIAALTASQRREMDDAGGEPDEMQIVTEVLEEEHRMWEARWSARRPT